MKLIIALPSKLTTDPRDSFAKFLKSKNKLKLVLNVVVLVGALSLP